MHQESLKKIGSRNQRGFLNNLSKKGFTTNKAFGELIANCSDAGASKIQFKYIIYYYSLFILRGTELISLLLRSY
jgi:hypothetical protein